MKVSLILKLNKDRLLKSGKYPLVFQIIYKRQRRLIYTGYKLFESSFNKEKQRVVTSDDQRFKRGEIGAMNKSLQGVRQQILSLINFLNTTREVFTVEDISILYQRKQNHRYLFTFADYLEVELLKRDRFGSAKNYRYTLNALHRFAKNELLMFEDIDFRFLKDYEMYLQTCNIKRNTIAFYLRNLRAIYNKAIDQGIFELPAGGSPFDKLSLRAAKTVKRAIPSGVIKQIQELNLSSRADLDFSRDLFMFSFYTRGMSFVDIIHLQTTNIEQNTISYYRAKTKSLIKVGITEQLQAIIDKYKNDSGYLLPCLSVQNSKKENYIRYRTSLAWHNRCLKDIGMMIGLNCTLTTYVARHSWATVAKEKGIPITVISESLGHSTETTTHIYLKDFDQDVLDEANRFVVEL